MTREEARNLMMSHVAAALPSGVLALWPDTPQNIPTAAQWVRPVVRHAIGGQSSLGGNVGERRFKHGGVLMVQIFTPAGDGMEGSDLLVQAFLTYFEAVRSSQVWYRNIRAMEIGKEGTAEQVNFLADFEYDNIH